METLERLGAADLVSVLGAYRDALRAHQTLINRLNVYPVPDGDTGTNMALTVESVLESLADVDQADLPAVCDAISYASLMGARGNSGVILSQVLRGLADAFKCGHDGDAATLCDGLARASAGAYAAVLRPAEGTILTVVREAANAALGCQVGFGAPSVVDILEVAAAAARAAVERTPEQLPVLKAAGVVDAGGVGVSLLFDAFLHVTSGRPLPVPPAPAGVGDARADQPAPAWHEPASDLRYEVMYLLEAPAETIPAFRDVWAGIGDSIAVVGAGNLWNCHIHTDDIGAAVEAALDVGRPRQIRVTDLFEQVEEERWVREADAAAAAGGADVATGRCAVVAVATGDGIGRIFHSLGVHQIVTGGQTMNPSTAQLLSAVEAAPAPEVVILPNNDNVVPVAEQVARLAAKTVAVVPTAGISEGFAALLDYDPEASAEDNAATMAAAAARVVAGEITRAVRPSTCAAGAIATGDYLGLSRRTIEVVTPVLADAACGLLSVLVSDRHEIVTVIEGDGASPAVTRRITGWLEEHRPAVTAEVHHGGQPLYPYLFSIE
jgi:DAK2 domain fusion protein YloV